ncbi:VWA domain-containing protein [Jannaschia sp. LMIT008]|uniref:VWA domain-containing protein n=1 Tax=Jannaschia maritima TaxID=3032585 RepID=UPI0028116A78|nr:VWA domain-containing protein [Jannaschia sp. LMIT008]
MTAWGAAAHAARCLADPSSNLRGLHLRARAGPVRDAFLALLPPARRVPPGTDADALFGALDLPATLQAGRPVHRPGLLDGGGLLVVPSAERLEPALAARLAGALDRGGVRLLLLDEGDGNAEGIAPALADRIGPVVDLDDLSIRDVDRAAPLPYAVPDGDDAEPVAVLVAVATRLGVASLRAPMAALALARASARLRGGTVDATDLAFAIDLVLVPRATRMPDPAEPDAPQDAEPDRPRDDDPAPTGPMADRVLDAVAVTLPDDLLARLAMRAAAPKGTGAGATRKGNRQGRPLPSRPGRPDGRARIDLVATLRAAAPWQRIRGGGPGRRPRVRKGDIRLRRRESRSDRLLVFVVDASGSSAMARLGEAKGAVETLLARAYARRDHVALVAFRGNGAEAILQPTRSLVRTKRELAALPGGGGTPLAAGLRDGAAMAARMRDRGMAPALVVLTDGRPNVALSGEPGRAAAMADAEVTARALRGMALPGLVIDTGRRTSPWLASLAATMGMTAMALPRADAAALDRAVTAAL